MNRHALKVAMLAGLAFAGAPMESPDTMVRPRPPRDDPPLPGERRVKPRKRKGPRSNEKRRPSAKARKKHKAKIAYASRRANRRGR